jgi:hypothetical protein
MLGMNPEPFIVNKIPPNPPVKGLILLTFILYIFNFLNKIVVFLYFLT